MKHFLCGFMALLLCAISFGQDKLGSYNEMVGQEVIIFGAKACFDDCGPYAYSFDGKRYKIIRDGLEYESFDSIPVKAESIVEWKKKTFLHISTTLKNFYLLLDDKIDFLSRTRSITYWRDQFNKYTSEYPFIRASSPLLAGDAYGKPTVGEFLPISWNSLQLPKRVSESVGFDCSVNHKQVRLSGSDVLQNLSSLVTTREYLEQKRLEDAQRREKERLDSIADCTRICKAELLHLFEVENALKKAGSELEYASSKDTLFLYAYRHTTNNLGYRQVNKYTGSVLGYDIELPESSLSFLDSSDKEFLKERGENGVELRKLTAHTEDLNQMEEFAEKKAKETKELLAKLEALDKFNRQKKIFLQKKDYSFSDYQFGLEMTFYNCFNKDIKYIDITIKAYNQVGDLQKDYFGKAVKNVQCIGPLVKGNEGVWDFDKLFWDEYDIIDKLEITDVKFTFMDNSTLKYSGMDKIKQHWLQTYSKEVLKILGQ